MEKINNLTQYTNEHIGLVNLPSTEQVYESIKQMLELAKEVKVGS